MKTITVTVTCDNCGARITVTADRHSEITRQLAEAGFPRLRGHRDYCGPCLTAARRLPGHSA